MKSKFSILFILILSVLMAGLYMSAGAEAEVFSEAGLNYTVNSDSTATVTGFSGEAVADLVIPESLGGYTVSAIGANAFKNSNIQSLILPSTVKAINNSAFNGCTELNTIDLPEGLITIGNYAFQNCSLLTEMTFPASLQSVGSYNTFIGCTGIKK